VSALRRWFGVWSALLLGSCAGYDPTSEGSSAKEDLTREMSEAALGTESGNPTEPVHLGTESGNPDLGGSTPSEQTGTESGNPTQPPPVNVPLQVEPHGTVTAAGEGPDDGLGSEASEPVSDGPAADDPAAVPPETDAMSPTSTPEGNGAAPMAGSATDPCSPASCEATAEQVAASLAAALAPPEPFSDAVCSEFGACTCVSNSTTVELVTGGADECLVQGRLECLVFASDFQACDPLDAASCQASCDAVFDARAADAMGHALTVRASACGVSGCGFILESSDGHCHVGGAGLPLTSMECAVADESLTPSP
jgi:hypothetical protein